MDAKVKSFLLGTILAGGVSTGLNSCRDNDEDAQPKKEVKKQEFVDDTYGNIEFVLQKKC